KVKVLEVDPARKRISLSMKLDAAAPRRDGARENRFEAPERGQQRAGVGKGSAPHAPAQGAMASAFAKLQGLKR
nr:hypothetical protein [Comamonas sp.]